LEITAKVECKNKLNFGIFIRNEIYEQCVPEFIPIIRDLNNI